MKRRILTPQAKVQVALDKEAHTYDVAGQVAAFLIDTSGPEFRREGALPSTAVQLGYLSIAKLAVGDYVQYVPDGDTARFEHVILEVTGAYSKLDPNHTFASSRASLLFVRVELKIPPISGAIRYILSRHLLYKKTWKAIT